jgi:hypothetical protein
MRGTAGLTTLASICRPDRCRPRKFAMPKPLRHLTIESLLASPFVTAVVLVSLLSFAAVVFGPS